MVVSTVFQTHDCVEQMVSFLSKRDQIQLGNVSNAIGCSTYRIILLNQLKDPKVRSQKNNDQMEMAEQTYNIIIKSRFKMGKRYQCLKALSASLIDTWEPEAFSVFRRIALADIPHFILTRCWQIEMSWSEVSSYSNPDYNPITERALSALIQAKKNTLYTPITSSCCFPHVIFTEGNHPKLGLMLNENTRHAFEVLRNCGKYSEMSFAQRRATRDRRFGICNIRYMSRQEESRTAAAINRDVFVRNKFTTSERILDQYLPPELNKIVQGYLAPTPAGIPIVEHTLENFYSFFT